MTNFGLMQHHNYNLYDLENMMPWEREVYLGLLVKWLDDEKRRHDAEEAKQKRG
jgi:hypothetical protein